LPEPFPLLAYRLSYPLTQLPIDSLELYLRAVGPGVRFGQEAAPLLCRWSLRIRTLHHDLLEPCMGFLLSSVSLFDLEIRFFVPTRSIAQPARAGAVKVGRHTYLSTSFGLARPYLDRSEHGGTLDAIGMTIRGEPAFRVRKSIAPHPCIRWGPGPEP
jgi:hypothetical protein